MLSSPAADREGRYPYRWQGKPTRIRRFTSEDGMVLEFVDGTTTTVAIADFNAENAQEAK